MAAAREDAAERILDFEAMGAGGGAPIDPAWYPHLLAVGLSVSDDPARAAAIVGIPPQGDGLAALLLEARKLDDLTKRKPSAIGGLLTAAISCSAIKLAASVHSIAPNQLPQAIRALAQANEMLCGSALPTTGSINISIKAAA